MAPSNAHRFVLSLAVLRLVSFGTNVIAQPVRLGAEFEISGGANYCPSSPVTREEMGVFISVTFGLTLYGP